MTSTLLSLFHRSPQCFPLKFDLMMHLTKYCGPKSTWHTQIPEKNAREQRSQRKWMRWGAAVDLLFPSEGSSCLWEKPCGAASFSQGFSQLQIPPPLLSDLYSPTLLSSHQIIVSLPPLIRSCFFYHILQFFFLSLELFVTLLWQIEIQKPTPSHFALLYCILPIFFPLSTDAHLTLLIRSFLLPSYAFCSSFWFVCKSASLSII